MGPVVLDKNSHPAVLRFLFGPVFSMHLTRSMVDTISTSFIYQEYNDIRLDYGSIAQPDKPANHWFEAQHLREKDCWVLLGFLVQWSDKVCWVYFNCYIILVITVVSLWSPRKMVLSLTSGPPGPPLGHACPHIQKWSYSYSTYSSGLCSRTFGVHFISSVFSGTQYLFIHALIEYLLWRRHFVGYYENNSFGVPVRFVYLIL